MEQKNQDGSGFRKEFGEGGERVAESYLQKRGFRLVSSNYFTRWGEIDLVMMDGRTLVFIEVKRRSNDRYGEPEESITRGKMKHLVKAALQYVQDQGLEPMMFRFDVVCISGAEIRHYPNAFDAVEFWI